MWSFFFHIGQYQTTPSSKRHPTNIFDRLHANTLKQWDILEKRLSSSADGQQEQQYIALKDRPTLADLSYFPFAMPWMFTFLGVDIKDWPAIQRWSERMLARKAVKEILERAPRFGHD